MIGWISHVDQRRMQDCVNHIAHPCDSFHNESSNQVEFSKYTIDNQSMHVKKDVKTIELPSVNNFVTQQ